VISFYLSYILPENIEILRVITLHFVLYKCFNAEYKEASEKFILYEKKGNARVKNYYKYQNFLMMILMHFIKIFHNKFILLDKLYKIFLIDFL